VIGHERRERFRSLPEPVRPEDAVETVDVEERFLREAGAG
jgi:hypothetical protein